MEVKMSKANRSPAMHAASRLCFGYALLVSCLAIYSCASVVDAPIESSVYIGTGEKGFVLVPSTQAINFVLLVVPLKPLPSGAVIEARFENPAGGSPLVVTTPVKTSEKMYMIESPTVHGLKPRDYRVDILLFADAGKTGKLDQYVQRITSYFDQGQ
jgi:hypothetical protein